jgi:hypothetical protein
VRREHAAQPKTKEKSRHDTGVESGERKRCERDSLARVDERHLCDDSISQRRQVTGVRHGYRGRFQSSYHQRNMAHSYRRGSPYVRMHDLTDIRKFRLQAYGVRSRPLIRDRSTEASRQTPDDMILYDLN